MKVYFPLLLYLQILNRVNFYIQGSMKEKTTRFNVEMSEMHINITPPLIRQLVNTLSTIKIQEDNDEGPSGPIEYDLDLWNEKYWSDFNFWFLKIDDGSDVSGDFNN